MKERQEFQLIKIKTKEMKRYITGIVALIIAALTFAFTKPAEKNINSDHSIVTYYYKFVGIHGQENDMNKWVQISEEDYEKVGCPSGNEAGCLIQNTTNSGGHPTLVPLSGVNGHPILSSPTTDLINRN